MKKIFLLSFISSVLLFVSCEKDKNFAESQTTSTAIEKYQKSLGNTTSRMGFYTLYQATETEIQAGIDSFVRSFQSGEASNTDRPSACGRMLNSYSLVDNITVQSGSFCSNTAIIYIKYRFCIIEWGNPAPSANFSFSTSWPTGSGSSYSVNELPPVDMSTPLNWYTLRQFEVTGTMTSGEYNMSGGTTNTVTRTGEGSGCQPETLNDFTTFVLSSNYYCNHSAIIYILPNTPQHGIFVLNQCNVLTCPAPYISCPTTGTFKYRVAGSSGAWISLTMNTAFYANGITGLTSGTYEYECTLTYGACTSLPATGTFVIP